MKTKVIFRKWPKNEGDGVIAIFPAIAATVSNPYHCQSYEHTGQHGACDPLMLACALRLATPSEYGDLACELRRIGYKLRICKRISPLDLEARKTQLKP